MIDCQDVNDRGCSMFLFIVGGLSSHWGDSSATRKIETMSNNKMNKQANKFYKRKNTWQPRDKSTWRNTWENTW